MGHLVRARRLLRDVVRTTRRGVLVLTRTADGRRRGRRIGGAVTSLRTAHAACLVAHLAADLWSGRRRRLPPLTAALLATLLVIHLVRGPVGVWLFPHLRLPTAAVCIRPAATLAARRLDARLIVGSVVAHVDVAHVLYNVAATAAWLPSVEVAAGPAGTAAVLAALAVISHGMTVLLAVAVAAVGLAPNASRACIMGASGVLFGVRVLGGSTALTTRPGRRDAAAGTRLIGGAGIAPGLPAVRLPVWAATIGEAALLSAVHPRASFVGHAAGILAGWVVMVGVLGARALSASASQWWTAVVQRRGGMTLHVATADEGGVDIADESLRDGATGERPTDGEPVARATRDSGRASGHHHRRPHAVADS